MQIRLVADGYDPALGIMHYDRDGAPAFVFDMMEPDRPKVDRTVLGFLNRSRCIRRISRSKTMGWLGSIRSWRGGWRKWRGHDRLRPFPCTRDYGNTKHGAYMCEADAQAAGNRAAKNERHP